MNRRVAGGRRRGRTAGTRSWLVDQAYPDAIRLVLDNLNTHKLGSLYEASPRRRIAKTTHPFTEAG